MTATHEDYAWVDEQDWMEGGYCLSYIREKTPEQVIAGLGATAGETVRGVEGLSVRSCDIWDGPHAGSRLVVGVASLGDGSVMVEVNGYVGVTPELMQPLSVGGAVVSHFRNVNAVDRLHWWEDGELRLDFEPLVPYLDDIPPELRERVVAAGIDDSDDDDDSDDFVNTAAAFGLAENLTGVRITPSVFDDMEFLTAEVTLPTP